MQGEGEEGEDGFEKMKSAKEKKKVRAAELVTEMNVPCQEASGSGSDDLRARSFTANLDVSCCAAGAR